MPRGSLYLYTTLDDEALIVEQVQEKLDKFSDSFYVRVKTLNSSDSIKKGEYRSFHAELLKPIKLPNKKK